MSIITGTSANNTLSGTATSDVISGLEGADNLYGNAGNDTLNGGVGEDALYGGVGSDTYVFNLGDGADVINDYNDSGLPENNIIKLGAGFTAADLRIYFENGDMVVRFANSVTDSITIKYHFYDDPRWKVSTIQFNDNSQLNIAIGSTDYTLYTVTDDAGGVTYTNYDGSNVMTGGSGSDTFYAGAGNDSLDGGLGNDTLWGGDGNDTYYVDNVNDVIYDSDGNDTLYIGAGADNYRTNGIENVVYQSADTIKLAYFIDALESGESWSTTIATATNVNFSFVDVSALAGFRAYTATEKALVRSVLADYSTISGLTFTEVTDTDSVQIRLFLDDTPSDRDAAGYANYPSSSGSEVHILPSYADSYHLFAHELGHALGLKHPGDYNAGGGGTDGPYLPIAEDNTANTNMSYEGDYDINQLQLFDIAAIQYLYGVNGTQRTGNNSYSQNDRYIWDGGGVDTLSVSTATAAVNLDLRAGAWSYVGAKNASILGAGQFFIGLGTQIENATGSQWNDTIRGNAVANTLIGGAGNDNLRGGAGADILRGGVGNDTYILDVDLDTITELAGEGTDTVLSVINYTLATNVENLTLTGSVALNGNGNALNNTLTGNSANNILNGLTGADTLIGGLGNDTYVVDNVGDVITEVASAGTDLVQSSLSYTLGLNVENLTLTGTVAINGTGNTLINTLTGNSGNNILNGGTGADRMLGGVGNDTYVIDNAGDLITEGASAGTDLVQSSITYTLATNVEALILTGASVINGTGNTLNNTLTGNGGNNILNGLTGIDTMIGGLGNDTYVIDNAGDIVTEALSAGTDLVQSSLSYTLGLNVENLTLTGAAVINGTGNTLTNTLTGNGGHNILNGGTGADRMLGGLGNDTYVVDSTGDLITEALSAGTDLVQSSITYTLVTNLEALTLTGTAAINGTGNTLSNTLTGNIGHNILNGLTGIDTMIGGLGNDTYVVDNAGDIVTEAAAAGTDLVQSSVTYTLATNVDALTLTGAGAINGTGNALANTFVGNTANNIFTGGLGNDIYNLSRTSGTDSVVENDATAGNSDALQFASDVRADQIWFRKLGMDLEVDIIGASNKALIKNWYLGLQTHVEQFVSGDGKVLLDTEVQSLVDAMATLSATPPATINLSSSQQTTLDPVFATYWT